MSRLKNKLKINRLLDSYLRAVKVIDAISDEMQLISKKTASQIKTTVAKMQDVYDRCYIKDETK